MSLCKTRADLHREYARVIDMCEGLMLRPWRCVKDNTGSVFTSQPALDADPEKYSFALAIVEGKPVFPGDLLYWKLNGNKVTITECILLSIDINSVSWNPPQPKKLVLNGVELPMPCDDPDYIMWIGFENINDAENFKKLFSELVATQKDSK